MNIEEIEPEMCFQIDYYGETIWIAKMVDDPYETAQAGHRSKDRAESAQRGRRPARQIAR